MSIHGPLFQDLQPRRVVGLNLTDGTAMVREGDDVVVMEIWAGASGTLCLHRPEPVPIDQEGEREVIPVSQRWSGCDQV